MYSKSVRATACAAAALLVAASLAARSFRLDGMTLPMLAIAVRGERVLRLLLLLGADPNAEAQGVNPLEGIPDGVTALWVAALEGDLEAVNL